MRCTPRIQRWLAGAVTLTLTSGSLLAGPPAASDDAIGPQERDLAFLAVRPLCDGALLLGRDAGLYEGLAGLSDVQLQLPLPDGSTVSLRLERREVLTADARIVVAFGAEEIEVEPPAGHFLAGSVVGDPESLVVLGVTQSSIQGLLIYQDEMFSLSSGQHGAGLPLVVSSMADLPDNAITWAPFECGVDGSMDKSGSFPEEPPSGLRDDSTCRVVEVAIETDWEFTERFDGDTEEAAAYVLLLMTANAEIYSRHFNVGLQVCYLRLWADSNDPWDAPSSGDQLNQFRDYWQANMQHVERNLAHFLSPRNLGGGVAWVGVVCNPSWGYSLSGNLAGSFPYPLVDHSSQNWDIFVTAHELGHNHGAPHTHDLNPPADGCGLGDCSNAWGGTIMSYCHGCSGGMRNIVLSFHERITEETVMPYLRSRTCLDELVTPLILSQPESMDVCAGRPVVLAVTVSSLDPLTYQWWKDGAELPGETESQLVLLELGWDDTGAYEVAVSNGCETIFSDAAQVEVYSIQGDITGDGYVGQEDLAFLLAYYEHSDGGDMDGDGDTDQSDLGLLLVNFGQSCE